MIKIFEYGKTKLKIKTNILKEGKCYFGDKNITNEFKNIVNTINPNGTITSEAFLITLWETLRSKGIAPLEISIGNIIYKGAKMTEFKQSE